MYSVGREARDDDDGSVDEVPRRKRSMDVGEHSVYLVSIDTESKSEESTRISNHSRCDDPSDV